jgi:hypothetical protein
MHKAKVARAAEPSIEEMLGEPIVRALMAADGVRVNELEALFRSVAERLRASRSRAPTPESFGLSNPETTPTQSKTTSATGHGRAGIGQFRSVSERTGSNVTEFKQGDRLVTWCAAIDARA